MARPGYYGQVQDDDGNVVASPTIEVRRDVPGKPLVQCFAARRDGDALGNPFVGNADGSFLFFVDEGGAFEITVSKIIGAQLWEKVIPYVAIATGAEFDFGTIYPPKGGWNALTTYGFGESVAHRNGGEAYAFVSMISDNLNNEPQFVEGVPDLDDENWQVLGLIQMPGTPGEGLDFEHGPVADLTARDAFVGIEVGQRIAVSDIGNGRSAIYKLDSDSPQTWSAPLYVSGVQGAQGIAATIDVGSVITVNPDVPASVANIGTPQDAVLAFAIPKGAKGDPYKPDEVVDTFADRADYDDEEKGFSVAVRVDENEDGASYIYFKNSNTSADWSGPLPFPGGGGGSADADGVDTLFVISSL